MSGRSHAAGVRSEVAIMDGSEAAAHVAYRLSELCLVHPVTPAAASSPGLRNGRL